MTLPDRAEILERERRFSRPAGIAAIAGAVLTIAGLFIRGSALDGDSTSELLLDAATGDSDGQLMLGAATSGLGLILLAIPLTFLFMAARDRSERVRGAFLYMAGVGAILLAVGGVVNNTAYLNAADDFAAAEEQRSALPSATLLAQGDTTVAPTTTGETDATTTESGADEGDDEEEDADDRARDAIREASGFATSAGLSLAGTLAFALGFFYTSLWAMRTGLMTRFWGSLGMACAVVFVLIVPSSPPMMIFQEVWFMALGFMLLGVWVGRKPPAWETGKATPWLKPGEQPPGEEDGDPDLIEGEGREVTGEPGGDPPRKRKRRQ